MPHRADQKPGPEPVMRESDGRHEGLLRLAVTGLPQGQSEQIVLHPGGANPLAPVGVGDRTKRNQPRLPGIHGQGCRSRWHLTARAHHPRTTTPHRGRLQEGSQLAHGDPLPAARSELACLKAPFKACDGPAGPRLVRA